ncbi:hypothetical protein AB0D67_14545 [Streptosporangium sp. NPDC048047]|uniref:hypothetical protein n=1 Tax=Streptosporangium sp. NPDC048047 TaxID=3155748 RepID=UPI003420AFF5
MTLMGQNADNGSKETPEGEFLLAIVRRARNCTSIPDKIKDALAQTSKKRVRELSCTQDSRTVTIRRYDAYRDEIEKTVSVERSFLRATIDKNADSEKPFRIEKVHFQQAVEKKIEQVTSFWEVEDRNDWIKFPMSFIFLSENDALSLHAPLIAQLTNQDLIPKDGDISSRIPDFLLSYYESIARVNGAIIPKAYEQEERSVDVGLLKAIAAAQRGDERAPKSATKNLALELYKQGEKNIRAISMATGLSRDTIYILLYAEGLKDFPLSHIVSEYRRSISSGSFKDGSPAPTVDEITKRWNISIKEARKVLLILRAAGLVRATSKGESVINNTE